MTNQHFGGDEDRFGKDFHAVMPEQILPRLRKVIDRAVATMPPEDIAERLKTQPQPYAALVPWDNWMRLYWGHDAAGKPRPLLSLDYRQLCDARLAANAIDYIPAPPLRKAEQ
jgi:hypothetical protein